MSGSKQYTLDDFDFYLPDRQIAFYPPEKRGTSKLLVLDADSGSIEHRTFENLPDYFHAGDLVIRNNVRVLHARLYFIRGGGGRVEFLFLKHRGGTLWETITNRTARLSPGEKLTCEGDKNLTIVVIERSGDRIIVETSTVLDHDKFEKLGEIPLPPYINRKMESTDVDRYQTVYASRGMAVAAPTAGLHFTEEINGAIINRGVLISDITLDISWGTFQPVRYNNLAEHVMHEEEFEISEETAKQYNSVRSEKSGALIAIGTTTLRVLESALNNERIAPGRRRTDIFIYPPVKIKSVDSLVTNFHTPRSTLLMLVCAVAGYDNCMAAYREAVETGYRFFSYGDAMLIKNIRKSGS